MGFVCFRFGSCLGPVWFPFGACLVPGWFQFGSELALVEFWVVRFSSVVVACLWSVSVSLRFGSAFGSCRFQFGYTRFSFGSIWFSLGSCWFLLVVVWFWFGFCLVLVRFLFRPQLGAIDEFVGGDCGCLANNVYARSFDPSAAPLSVNRSRSYLDALQHCRHFQRGLVLAASATTWSVL